MFNPIPVNGDKIIAGETWEYTDSNNNMFEEISLETLQHQTISEDFMAVSKVNTSRTLTRFPLNFHFKDITHNSSFQIDFNLKSESLNELYLTQEGGFPLYMKERLFGQIVVETTNADNITINNIFEVDEVVDNQIDGSPSTSITTTESDSYRYVGSVFHKFPITDTSGQPNNMKQIYLEKEYVLSTDQSIVDSVRNYTITPFSTKLIYLNMGDRDAIISSNILFVFELTLKKLDVYYTVFGNLWENSTVNYIQNTLNLTNVEDQIEDDTMQMSFDIIEKLPTYIKQTIPATISEDSLSLSTSKAFIEYFLVNKVQPTIVSTPTSISTTRSNLNLQMSITMLFLITIAFTINRKPKSYI